MMSLTSARAAAWAASVHSRCGSASPNQTTPGRNSPPHVCSMRSMGKPSSIDRLSPHRLQRASRKFPCSSRTLREPARRWSESTFWVAKVKSSQRASRRASARCAGLGSARLCAARRSLYHVQTKCGSRAKPSGDASCSTRCVRHRPPTPRNVGKPLSAEIPEPVSTKTDVACCNRRATSSIMCAGFVPPDDEPRNVTE